MPRLLRLRSAWGLPGLHRGDRRALFGGLRAAGWDGVEASLPDIGTTADERRECCAAARAEGMSLILSAYSSWHSYEGPCDATLSVAGHVEAISAELHEIAELSAAHGAIRHVNGHSGIDSWGEGEARDFFEAVASAARGCGDALPPLSHETHRGRYLCCPFATARMLAAVPSLRLTSDFSHWVVKCERLLDAPGERELLDAVIAPAVDHVHARIGTPQAPQVAQVAAGACRRAAERHYAWWEAIWTARHASSLSARDATLTATIEYGPVEVDDEGEYCGYTPVDAQLAPVASAGHDATASFEATLVEARGALDERFERWHSERVAAGLW
jgi:hypothetical protein